MKSSYFCGFHAERIKSSESEALRYWAEIIRRGKHAYDDCRTEAAELYLGAALDIGLLRYQCKHNAMLLIIHITKPADLLLELLCAVVKFDAAVAVLSRISSILNSPGQNPDSDLLAWLAMKYQRVERAEKDYMLETVVDRARSNYRYEHNSVIHQ